MPERIHSLQNPRVKQIVRLRDSKFRRQTGLIVVDGLREIRQALLGGLDFVELFASDEDSNPLDCLEVPNDFLTSDHRKQLFEIITPVTPTVLEKLAYGQRSAKLVAVVREPVSSLDQLKLSDATNSIILVADQVEKPGNLGAMFRTADAVGVHAIIASDAACDVWNANAIRASLGAIFRVPLARATASETIRWLEKQQFKIFAARVDGSSDFQQVSWPSRTAILVGSEAEGLGTAWQLPSIQAIHLPMVGSVDSLNVSVTAAVLLYACRESFRE